MNINSSRRVTVPSILRRKNSKTKISALTAYDFTVAKLIDRAGIDIILVGDSLGTVIQGHDTTLPVTLDQMTYHCSCVSRGVKRALVVGDLPFLSYQPSVETAIKSAGRLIKEGGVSAVKLEGGINVAAIIEALTSFDIPVMGHVGLTPQSYHRMGGHRKQGKKQDHGGTLKAGTRERILEDARAVEKAGAFSLVIEGVPADLALEITETLSIPTIGIGAGPHCDGQILVVNDLLGLDPDFKPSFVKRYAELGLEIDKAVKAYINEISSGEFPLDDLDDEYIPLRPRVINSKLSIV
ncbi:MAG: 3-methyl-2-oxobutanoate hydroxymethyltransferase [Candidatus Dadabacteria bacterium]|nr:MAG: 3-methyl-2-oxobutanoate hydroxymethyltransferase [Candidatus Dadabacteria bacterium]